MLIFTLFKAKGGVRLVQRVQENPSTATAIWK